MHGGQSQTDAAGEPARAALRACVSQIGAMLHEPYEREAVKLREKRQHLAQELLTAQHQRAGLRNAMVTAQGARAATLALGDDPAEHAATADALSVEVEALERLIADTATRLRAIEAKKVALIEREADFVRSGVSAS
jgi:hypothetical protein